MPSALADRTATFFRETLRIGEAPAHLLNDLYATGILATSASIVAAKKSRDEDDFDPDLSMASIDGAGGVGNAAAGSAADEEEALLEAELFVDGVQLGAMEELSGLLHEWKCAGAGGMSFARCRVNCLSFLYVLALICILCTCPLQCILCTYPLLCILFTYPLLFILFTYLLLCILFTYLLLPYVTCTTAFWDVLMAVAREPEIVGASSSADLLPPAITALRNNNKSGKLVSRRSSIRLSMAGGRASDTGAKGLVAICYRLMARASEGRTVAVGMEAAMVYLQLVSLPGMFKR